MELQNLSDIFNNKIFRIPDYQRGYSWDQKQLDDLWRDINNIEDGNVHYTGLLTVDPQKDREVHVVDGQQRLTSLIILIHVILNCEKLHGNEWINGTRRLSYQEKYLHRQTGAQGEITEMIFGYEKDNPSNIHFKTKIIGIDDAEGAPLRTLYTNNLDFSKKFFEKKIGELDNVAKVESILDKVTKQLSFLYYQLNEKLNQFVTFEGMNDRGKALSVLELLKNRLMYLSTKLPGHDDNEKDKLRKDINEVWKVIYEYLGKNPTKALSDNEFLSDHWLMYFDEYTRSKKTPYREFLLEKHFTVDRAVSGKVKYKDIREYVLDLKKVVPAWCCTYFPDYYCDHFSASGSLNEAMQIWLAKLVRFGYYSFRPIVASLLANNPDQDAVLEIVKQVERFNFLAFGAKMRVPNTRSDFRSGDIYELTHSVHRKGRDITADDVSPENLGGNYSLYSFTRNEFCENWLEYEDGCCSWGAHKYFLYEYELHLQEGNKTMQLWEKVGHETTEHIYPQNPRKGWKKFRSKKAQDHRNYLGNLMLLTREHNSAVGNKPFADKKKIYKTCSYSAIEVADYKDWTPDTIMERQQKMLNFLWERWEIQTPVEIDLT